MREATEAGAKGLRDAEAMVAHFSRKPLQAISGFLRGDGPRFFSLSFPPFMYDFFGYRSHFLYTMFLQMSLSLSLSFFTIVVRKRATAS